ncbi:MAG: potassium-transporting ATPase subunit C [Candidatus Bathyarchaeia archaeon]|jgi:potassium-transporting ATPase KdpC subunit
MQTNKKQKWRFRQAISLALLSLLICGIVFPLLVTGLAQVFFPNQANGEIIQFNGQSVGSNLIAQNFTLPIFFHPRNDSASGVDPDITLQDAYSQLPRIQNATNIPIDALTQLVNQNTEGTYWIFGSPYVNVLRINLALVKAYPSVYIGFQ